MEMVDSGGEIGIGCQGTWKVPEKGLVPVTVKMVLDDAKLPGSFHQMLYRYVTVRFVGRVVDISNSDVSSKFVLDDGTGQVGVNYWFCPPGVIPLNLREISVGGYVHVVGRMEKKDGQLLVQAFSCWKVRDYNDITHHFVSTIHSFIVLGGRVGKVIPSGGISGEEINQDCTILKTDAKDNGVAGTNNGNEKHVDGPDGLGKRIEIIESAKDEEVAICKIEEQPFGGSELQDCVMSLIRRHQSEANLEGVSVHELIVELGIDECELRDTLRQLKEVGEIYETVDDDHYGAT